MTAVVSSRRSLRTVGKSRRTPLARVPITAWLASALIVAAAVATPFAVSMTSASFTDQGKMSTSFEASFQLGGVAASGRVAVNGTGLVTATYPASTAYVPGATATLPLTVFNNSAHVDADVTLTAAATGPFAHLLRFSVVWTDATGDHVLAGDPNAPQNGVSLAALDALDLGELSARDRAPLVNGAVWSGPTSSSGRVSVLVHLLNTQETRAVANAQAGVTLTVAGESR